MNLQARSLAATILKIVAIGGVLTAALIAPNIVRVAKPLLRYDDERALREARKWRIRETLRRLAKRRLIRLAVRNGREYLEITTQGRRQIREFDFETLSIPPPAPSASWDRRWRIVMFDIAEKRRRARRLFQNKLTLLGFYPLQRSVFVYPYPCRDEIDYLTEFLEISGLAIYCETEDLGRSEGRMREHFKLLA